MWATEYAAVTPTDPAVVWAALRGLLTGDLTYPGADRFELHGPFAVGSVVSVTPVGQHTLSSTIIDLVDTRTYADETVFGELTLRFRHTLEPVDGGTRVTHSLEISGGSDDVAVAGLGQQISADFDESMAGLFSIAARLASSADE